MALSRIGGDAHWQHFRRHRQRRVPASIMHRLGVFALILGALGTFGGLGLGFGFMFAGDDALARLLLAVVPVGFLLGFTGVVMTLLSEPEANE